MIDFAAALYGLGKKEAAVQLAQDFGLSYEDSQAKSAIKPMSTAVTKGCQRFSNRI